jgi:hypothetical protein
MRKNIIAALATGVFALALLTPVTGLLSDLGGNSVTTNTTANVTSTGGNTSASVNNQTGLNLLGNTVQTSTGVTTQLGL